MSKNYYIILGIPAHSSQKEIKAAYRKLAKEYHPDHYGPESSLFRGIQEAYSVLSDPKRRKTYDRELEKNDEAGRRRVGREELHLRVRSCVEPLVPERGADTRHPGVSGDTFRFGTSPIATVFDLLFGNPAQREYPSAQRPKRMVYTVPLTWAQSAAGGQVEIGVAVAVDCPRCATGRRHGPYGCRRCNGTGYIEGEIPITIRYPPGIRNGSSFEYGLDAYGLPGCSLTVYFQVR